MKGNTFNKKGDYIMMQEFYGNITITMQTLYYSLLWLAMMLIAICFCGRTRGYAPTFSVLPNPH